MERTASEHVLGHSRVAIRCARRAVERLGVLVGRLDDREGASYRSRWAGLFEIGLAASLRAKRPEDAAFFLESERAGSLLEALARSSASSVPARRWSCTA